MHDRPTPSIVTRRLPSSSWAYLIPLGNTAALIKGVIELSRIRPIYRVGRGEDSDIIVAHQAISSSHCILCQTISEDGSFHGLLEDCSHHGTFVNNVRVSNGRASVLRHGDVLSFAFQTKSPVLLKFHINTDSSSYMQYQIDSMIGRGAFAVVHSAIEMESGNKVALKVIRRSQDSMSGDGFFDIKREVEVMKGLDHPNIVDLRAVFDFHQDTYLVLELFPLGNLSALIGKRMLQAQAKAVTADICRALDYLHCKDIIHRDIKPANILVASVKPIYVKLGDFGLAKVFNREQGNYSICGTPSYMAPELMCAGRKGYTSRVDTWGLGVTLFKMLANTLPWENRDFQWKDSAPVPKPIQWKRLRRGVGCEARDFISELLELNPKCRPNVTEAMEHPWLAQYFV